MDTEDELEKTLQRGKTVGAEVLTNVISVSADPELSGFTLDLTTIWDPDSE
jgi:hypothetical protein